jgi:hypothetical protein
MNNGGIIGINNIPTATVASGMWRMNDAFLSTKSNTWPKYAQPDPYWANVVCLLNGEDYIDYSPLGLTYEMTGGTLSTGTKKFGASSLSFPGVNGNRLSTGYNAGHHFGASDYTIEFWIYPNAWTFGAATIMGSWKSPGQTALYGWLCQASAVTNRWQFIMNRPGSGVYNDALSIGFDLTIGVWSHVAYTRVGTEHTTYVNGVENFTVTDTSSVPLEPVESGYTYNAATSSGLWIGENEDFNQQPFNGYLDEIRITKGVARYTGDFTPPTEAFPRF